MSEFTQRGLGRSLADYTPARVGLRRAGVAVGTREQLEFQLDHARARDAVHARLDMLAMLAAVSDAGLRGVAVRSAVEAGPEERKTYLRRPDLGRRLGAAGTQALAEIRASGGKQRADVVFVVADGLSALAVERHAPELLAAVLPLLVAKALCVGPVVVVSQGRVAIGDEIGAALGARAVMVLIGERPGLSSADSLGVYLTWEPRAGRTDAERNCISNIHGKGLSYAEAAQRMVAWIGGARRLGRSGVALKGMRELE